MGEAALFDRGEPVAPPAIDFTEVKVEIGAFDDFIKLMQAELEQNLQPYSDQIIADHYDGSGTPIARQTPLYMYLVSLPPQSVSAYWSMMSPLADVSVVAKSGPRPISM